MPINGWCGGVEDNVFNSGVWADQSGHAYNGPNGNVGDYSFGPLINGFGTWGQINVRNSADLAGAHIGGQTGITAHAMPANPAPDGSNFVQGHLINGDCGGDGASNYCLTPISHNLNMAMKRYEKVLQFFCNRGPYAGSMVVNWNPNMIANTSAIFRAHALAPTGGNAFPSGIVISLSMSVNGVRANRYDINQELNQVGPVRWFSNHFYQASHTTLRQNMYALIGGVEIS